ncbi:MAG: hypothetical protein LBI63_05795 [Candidatus Ancillula sp.]|nr:hypothetical protein [Candidatus Ancillula sp.]
MADKVYSSRPKVKFYESSRFMTIAVLAISVLFILVAAIAGSMNSISGTFTGETKLKQSIDLISSDSPKEAKQDTTSRLNLYSYQRAAGNKNGQFGENIRHYMMKCDAKSMDAWYFPKNGYDSDKNPNSDEFVPGVWTGAHWCANNADEGGKNHKHWSIEVPDQSGQLQTRFEVVFGERDRNDDLAGLEITEIKTHQSNFTFLKTTDERFRILGSDTHPPSLELGTSKGNDSDTTKWSIEMQNKENGGNSGSDFAVVNYDDNGNKISTPLSIDRATSRIRIESNHPPTSSHDTCKKGEIAWDSNHTYVCVEDSHWKRTALEEW